VGVGAGVGESRVGGRLGWEEDKTHAIVHP